MEDDTELQDKTMRRLFNENLTTLIQSEEPVIQRIQKEKEKRISAHLRWLRTKTNKRLKKRGKKVTFLTISPVDHSIAPWPVECVMRPESFLTGRRIIFDDTIPREDIYFSGGGARLDSSLKQRMSSGPTATSYIDSTHLRELHCDVETRSDVRPAIASLGVRSGVGVE